MRYFGFTVQFHKQLHCLLLGKVTVAPKNFVSIPRLELLAATLSVKVACLVKNWILIKLRRGFGQTAKWLYATLLVMYHGLKHLLQIECSKLKI